MARGWESKFVEDQVQDSQTNNTKADKPQRTTSEPEAHRRREVLLLSRTQVERQLQSTQNPKYREQLTRALADLDAQIAELQDGL